MRRTSGGSTIDTVLTRRWLLLLTIPLATCTSVLPTPAPNVASPAPVATAVSPLAIHGQCLILPIRTKTARPSEVVEILGEQVPTFLPSGFGLFVGWPYTGGAWSRGAIWMDASCRQITLEAWSGDAVNDEPSLPEGRWVLRNHNTCKAGMLCLDYWKHADGVLVELSFVGLSQSDAVRVRSGVHL
jgi:hypothetical protein